MLKSILRTVGLEILEELADDIEDMLFGKFKEIAFFVGAVLFMLIIYFIIMGIHHTFN